VLEEIVQDLDQVLVMTVNPGFGHQQFIRTTLPKIERVRELTECWWRAWRSSATAKAWPRDATAANHSERRGARTEPAERSALQGSQLCSSE